MIFYALFQEIKYTRPFAIVEEGHTINEYAKLFNKEYAEGSLFDFSQNDLLGNKPAIEPQQGMVYWLINGRFYETTLDKPIKSNSILFLQRIEIKV